MAAAPRTSPELWISVLGTVPYGEAAELQQALCALRQADATPDLLLLLEHPPTYTRGRRSQPGELPLGEAFYSSRGIEVIDTDRGGRITYHGPGQLVGYPILRERDVVAHVRRMETAIVAALADAGIDARSRCNEGADFTGVWVEDRKIASIGVHHSRGVTTHGFAVNVENDLEPFSWIVPCGLSGVRMTSVAAELVAAAPPTDHATLASPLARFRGSLAERYCSLLERMPRFIPASELARLAEMPRAQRSAAAA